jgi:hypothetical protein
MGVRGLMFKSLLVYKFTGSQVRLFCLFEILNSLANLLGDMFLCKGFPDFSYTHVGKERCELGVVRREKGENDK